MLRPMEPAFPVADLTAAAKGIDLRTYLAAQALAGLARDSYRFEARPTERTQYCDKIGELAVLMADATLRALNQTNGRLPPGPPKSLEECAVEESAS